MIDQEALARQVSDLAARVAALEEAVKKSRAVTLADLKARGDLDGYHPFRGYDGDRAACTSATCEICGRVGLTYRAFAEVGRPEGAGYRPFAVCPVCGHAEAF